MIRNAKDTPLSLNPGTLPNVSGAISDWFQPLTFIQLVKTVSNFEDVEVPTPFTFMGVRQPMKPQELKQKPEGQRAWAWQTIHAYPDLILLVDDVITFSGVDYRVMAKLDWSEYGFVEYHIIEDYTR